MSLPHAQRKRTMPCLFVLWSRPLGRDQGEYGLRADYAEGECFDLGYLEAHLLCRVWHGGSECDGGPATLCHLA